VRGFSAVKLTLLAVSVLSIMAGTVVAPVLPSIQEAFAGGPRVALLTRLVLTMPALFVVLCAPLAGAASDRFGRRLLLLAALALYAASGVSGYFADTLPGLLLGRALLGVAVAVTMTTCTALIADYYQGVERAQLMGLQSAVSTAGAVLCLALGGYLAQAGWRVPFLLYLYPLLVLLLAALFISEPARLAAGPKAAGDVAAPRLLPVLFAAALLSNLAMYAVPMQIPFYLQGEFAIGSFGAGLAIACGTLFATLSSLLYGRLSGRWRYPGLYAASFVIMAAGFGLVAMATQVWIVLCGLALVGAAAGIQLPTINNWLMDIASAGARGKVLGGLTTAIFLGQFISPLLFTPLLHVVSYTGFFLILAAAMVLTAVLLRTVFRYLERQQG